MNFFLKLLGWLGIEKIISSAIKELIIYALEEIAEHAKDEDIDTIRQRVEKSIEEKINNLPTEVREIARESVKPILVLIFEGLKLTDDTAQALAESIKKLG